MIKNKKGNGHLLKHLKIVQAGLSPGNELNLKKSRGEISWLHLSVNLSLVGLFLPAL